MSDLEFVGNIVHIFYRILELGKAVYNHSLSFYKNKFIKKSIDINLMKQ